MENQERRDRVELDDHLQEVIVFMQSNVPAEKLVQIAEHIKNIAPLLWGHHSAKAGVQALRIEREAISPEQRKSSSATE